MDERSNLQTFHRGCSLPSVWPLPEACPQAQVRSSAGWNVLIEPNRPVHKWVQLVEANPRNCRKTAVSLWKDRWRWRADGTWSDDRCPETCLNRRTLGNQSIARSSNWQTSLSTSNRFYGLFTKSASARSSSTLEPPSKVFEREQQSAIADHEMNTVDQAAIFTAQATSSYFRRREYYRVHCKTLARGSPRVHRGTSNFEVPNLKLRRTKGPRFPSPFKLLELYIYANEWTTMIEMNRNEKNICH